MCFEIINIIGMTKHIYQVVEYVDCSVYRNEVLVVNTKRVISSRNSKDKQCNGKRQAMTD
jgi:hypothetical protein